jgi:hypothetical protein
MITAEEAAQAVINASPVACQNINTFSREVLKIRGGRLGSGMGTLLEALWGYYVNQALAGSVGEVAACEIGWLSDNEYNDFACILRDQPWVSADKTGELFRIEAKSMNIAVDESKAHFDELVVHLQKWDLLLVLIWSWDPVDEFRSYPHIKDQFIGPAVPVALLRDRLHIARGGSFVSRVSCPDACPSESCLHHGEPLNAKGKRERLSGPESTRPSANSSYAANFGGLVRMLKTKSETARQEFRLIRATDDVAHNYISFIYNNFPSEETNQYLTNEWKQLANKLGLQTKGISGAAVVDLVRTIPNYQDEIRALYKDVNEIPTLLNLQEAESAESP